MTENLEWHEVAKTSDLSPGEVMYVEVGTIRSPSSTSKVSSSPSTICARTKMRRSPTAK